MGVTALGEKGRWFVGEASENFADEAFQASGKRSS